VGKHIASETQTTIDDYNKALDVLMQRYRDRAVFDTHIDVINFYRILEDLNLDGMAYASGAGLNTTKQCLDGTRGEILRRLSTGSTTRTSMRRGSSGFTAGWGEENPLAHTIAL